MDKLNNRIEKGESRRTTMARELKMVSALQTLKEQILAGIRDQISPIVALDGPLHVRKNQEKIPISGRAACCRIPLRDLIPPPRNKGNRYLIDNVLEGFVFMNILERSTPLHFRRRAAARGQFALRYRFDPQTLHLHFSLLESFSASHENIAAIDRLSWSPSNPEENTHVVWNVDHIPRTRRIITVPFLFRPDEFSCQDYRYFFRIPEAGNAPSLEEILQMVRDQLGIKGSSLRHVVASRKQKTAAFRKKKK